MTKGKEVSLARPVTALKKRTNNQVSKKSN